MSVEGYLQSRNEFKSLERRVYQVGLNIGSVADILVRSPEAFGLNGPSAFTQWPSAQEIRALMSEYRRVAGEMRRHWNEIPAHLRSGMVSPDKPVAGPSFGYGG
jgi:hypothetical protein